MAGGSASALASYGIGAVLRAERVRQGLSLEEVARKTRISPRFLIAIEEEDFETLPGLVFARGFIRQYSNLLNLDTDGLLARMPRPDTSAMPLPDPATHQRIGVAQQNESSSFALNWDPRWNSAIASFLWIGLAAASAVGAYVYFNRSNSAPITSRAVPPPETAQPRPAQTPAPVPVSDIAPVSPQAPAAEETASKSGKPVQLTLSASEPAWVSITADGKNAYTGTMQPEETKSIEADTVIKLTAGNAGGLKATFNGKPLEPLGPKGQVRVVRFTVEGPQFSARTPSAPANDPL